MADDFEQDLFEDVEIVKESMVFIQESTQKLADINQRVLEAIICIHELEHCDELEPLIKSTNKKARIAKELLQRFRADTEKLQASNQDTEQTAEIRIRENLWNTLTRKFVHVMKEYQNAQKRYAQLVSAASNESHMKSSAKTPH